MHVRADILALHPTQHSTAERNAARAPLDRSPQRLQLRLAGGGQRAARLGGRVGQALGPAEAARGTQEGARVPPAERSRRRLDAVGLRE